jgi:VanZ family protein
MVLCETGRMNDTMDIHGKRVGRWWIGGPAVLFLLTLALFVGAAGVRYVPDGPNLVTDRPNAWRVVKSRDVSARIQGGAWLLEIPGGNDAPGYVTLLHDIDLDRPGLYRITAELHARAITPGEKAWHGGRLLLISLGADGKPDYKRPHKAAALLHTDGWENVEQVFRLDAAVQQVVAGVQLAGLSGRLAARNIAVVRVVERCLFSWARGILLLCWILLLTGGVYRLFSPAWRRLPVIVCILLMAAILAGTLLPNRQVTRMSSQILEWTRTSAAPADAPRAAEKGKPAALGVEADDSRNLSRIIHRFDELAATVPVKKLGHFILFALLLMAARRAKRGELSAVRIVLLCAAFALCTETLQFFTDDRGPNLVDFGIDLAGVLTGTAAAAVWKFERQV